MLLNHYATLLHSAGFRAQFLSIAGRMLYHLSYEGSTKIFSQNLFTPIWPRIYHELYTNFSESFLVDYVDN